MISISDAYTQRNYRWIDWKIHQSSKSLVWQLQEENGMYWIWGYDGPECFITQIWTGNIPYGVIQGGYTQEQNDLDKADFEANYKDASNNAILPSLNTVTTQFEMRNKTLKLFHGQADIGEDGLASMLIKIPGTPGSADGRWISSGTAFFDAHTPGDKVYNVSFIDQDNLLGYGEGFVVGTYTDMDADEVNQGWIILPNGFIKAEAIGGYGFAPAGFYIQIVGKKAGDSPSGKFYCNLEWGKSE